MTETGVQPKPDEGTDVRQTTDQHLATAGGWIAAAMAGIREMHLDEQARRRVADRLF